MSTDNFKMEQDPDTGSRLTSAWLRSTLGETRKERQTAGFHLTPVLLESLCRIAGGQRIKLPGFCTVRFVLCDVGRAEATPSSFKAELASARVNRFQKCCEHAKSLRPCLFPDSWFSLGCIIHGFEGGASPAGQDMRGVGIRM